MRTLAAALALLFALPACAESPAVVAPAPPAALPEWPAPEGLPLVFEDDFSADLSRWEPTDPKAWKLEKDGERGVLALVQSSDYEPPVRSPKSIAWAKGVDVGDFVLEAAVRQTGREYGHRDLCFFFGRQDASHFYYVHLATKADDHANSIFLVDGAPRVSIAKERTDGTKWSQGYHLVRIKRTAATGRIEVYMDDLAKPVMTAEDAAFKSGAIGLGSFDDTGRFDRVRVWGSPPAP